MRLKSTSIIAVILILAASRFPGTVSAQAPPPCEDEYTVQAGDWLSKIAEKYFGAALAYDQVVTATNGQTDDRFAAIENPDLIEPGWLVCIPAAGSDSAAPSAGVDLTGPIWRWDQTVMNNDETFVPANPANYTVQFKPDGTVSIQADCNNVGGTYTVDGSSITIQTGPTTMMACPPGSLGDQFVAQLSGAAIYFIRGENLFIDLKFDSGTMQFTAESGELAGTSWDVIGYNNGREAVVSVIIGTEMTATFGEDGSLAGSAGCNNYNATYELSGETISIGPAATTRKFCAEPEGIMEQEQEYLAALQTAATYSIRGDRLELRTATGALAADFSRARDGGAATPDQPAGGTEVVQFDPTSVQLDPNQEPVAVASCEPSQVVPRPGAYQCVPEGGGNFDPCWVVAGNTLLCNPRWLPPMFEDPPDYTLATAPATLPDIDPAATEVEPVPFYLALEAGNPPCLKRADLEMNLAGQPVTHSCEAPGAWLVGDLDTSQPTWTAHRVITDPSGATVTDGPTSVEVRRAWVY
jgi:heat shock protein HslJ